MYTMLINVALKLNFTFISSVRNVSYNLKKMKYLDIFCTYIYQF
jgi:hypothetical protein